MSLWPKSESHLEGTYIDQLRNENVVSDKQSDRCKLEIKLVAEVSIVHLVKFMHRVANARTF